MSDQQRGKHHKPEPGNGRHHKADNLPLWPITNPETRTGEAKHAKQDPPTRDSGQ